MESKERMPVVNNVEEQVNNQTCSYSPVDAQVNQEGNVCGVINALTGEGTSDNDDHSVLNKRFISDDFGLEAKATRKNWMRRGRNCNMNIAVDLASPVSFLKQNVLHELKLRDPQLKILPLDKKIRALYCGFTNDKFNNLTDRLQKNSFLLPLDTEKHLVKRPVSPNRNRNSVETTANSCEQRTSSGFV